MKAHKKEKIAAQKIYINISMNNGIVITKKTKKQSPTGRALRGR